MKPRLLKQTTGAIQARAGIFLLVFVSLILAGDAFWYYRHGSERAGQRVPSGSMTAVLTNLPAPVEIRFYSILDQASVPAATFAFADRVDRLLAEFQQVANGKISVVRHDSASDADAAASDGLKPFNLEKGAACFLGLAVICGERRESLPQIQPVWEDALPYDLVRAIQRVAVAPFTPPLAREAARPGPAIVDSIHHLIPDISGVTVEEADRIFHAEFMKEFERASSESEKQVAAAQQQVVQAQNSGSADDLAAAQKKLLEVQLAQGEKIKRLAADLQTRLAVFQQMKTAAATSKHQ